MLNFFKNGMSFTTGFFLLAAVVVLTVMIPNIDGISEKFGFDTKSSLRAKTETQKIQIDTVVADNKTLSETGEKKDQIAETKLEVVTDNLTAKANTIETVAKINKTKDVKVKQLESTPTKTSAEIDKEISTVQIASVWRTYCAFNDDSRCNNPA